jgi:hypothetical protein
MSFENTAGIDVSNHYGVRTTGGTDGNIKTEGTYNEYVYDLSSEKLSFPFPVLAGVKVVGVDKSYATGSVTAIAIGGVSVNSASDASPVDIASSNTGVITKTGGTGGKLIIKYKRLA